MADYQTLANIAAPTMMPNAPIGAGGTAGWMYGSDKARQDQLIAQAAQQAKGAAEMEAMKAGEFTLAQPGRLANIDTANAQAADTRDAYASSGRESTFNDFKNKLGKQGQEEMNQAMPFLQQLAKASTDDEAADVLRSGKQMGNTVIRGKDITQLPPAAARKLAQMIVDSNVNSVPQQQKESIEQIRWGKASDVATIRTQGQVDAASIRAKATAEFQHLKASQPTLWSTLKLASKGDPDEMMRRYREMRVDAARQAQQGQLDMIKALLANNPEIADKLPAKASSVVPSAPANMGVKPVPKIGAVWQDAKGTGKILGIKKDGMGNVTQLNVEGLGVVDFK